MTKENKIYVSKIRNSYRKFEYKLTNSNSSFKNNFHFIEIGESFIIPIENSPEWVILEKKCSEKILKHLIMLRRGLVLEENNSSFEFKIEYTDRFFSRGIFFEQDEGTGKVLQEELVLSMEMQDILLFQSALTSITDSQSF